MKRFVRLVVLAFLLATPLPGRAQMGDVEFAEKLVRADYVEGLPYAKARELGPAGAERLIEMLLDPDEAKHHSKIVMALGISGAPEAYSALVEFRDREVEGEVDAAEYRARRTLPLAMGHLARTDSRAFQFLLEAARAEGPGFAPRWRYRYLRDERLAGILRRAAITGVATSGRPEASAALHQLEERARLDPQATDELRIHLGEARDLCDRVMREGPDPVFDRGAAP